MENELIEACYNDYHSISQLHKEIMGKLDIKRIVKSSTHNIIHYFIDNSALHSLTLDEIVSLLDAYRNLLEKEWKEYGYKEKFTFKVEQQWWQRMSLEQLEKIKGKYGSSEDGEFIRNMFLKKFSK